MIEVVWFKRDLRTTDHAPLAQAAAAGPVLPLYVIEPDYWAGPDTSARQWTATASALKELAARLAALGAPLVLRRGDVVEILDQIHRKAGIARLHAHEETGNGWTFERDRRVRAFCRTAGIPFIETRHFAVVRRLADRDDWSRHHAAHVHRPPLPEPAALRPGHRGKTPEIPDAADLGLADDGCAAPQPGSRQAALARLDLFLGGAGRDYRRAMSSPVGAAAACSRLSVPLATGALSIREAFALVGSARQRLAALPPEARDIPLTAIDSLVARLHWHCHFIQKLESEPELEVRSLHPAHEAHRRPTAPDDPVLAAWAEGRTGLPFVDACMRSLIATGWLTFRMRAMVQAVASYHLGLDWRASGSRLARLFTDYEPGIHWSQVQMQSGATGINTPRIYNPVKQGHDQDPDGAFTRRWVPELAGLPAALIHEPWRLPPEVQAAHGCRIGTGYPPPLVDPVAAARAARERLSEIRHDPDFRRDAARVFERHGSRKRRPGDDNPPATAARAATRRRKAARQLDLDL